MQLILHSKEMFPTSIRSKFELPVWPYREGSGGEIPHELRDYLRGLTVFRLLDDYVGERGQFAFAIMIPDLDGTWAQNWPPPIKCFEHHLWIDGDTLQVITWPNDRPEGYALHTRIMAEIGDNYAWAEFNKPVVLHSCNSQSLHYISGHDNPGNISSTRGLKL